MEENEEAAKLAKSADTRAKSDNPSVYQEPAVQQKTNQGEAVKKDPSTERTPANTFPDQPDEETTTGVDKV